MGQSLLTTTAINSMQSLKSWPYAGFAALGVLQNFDTNIGKVFVANRVPGLCSCLLDNLLVQIDMCRPRAGHLAQQI